MVRQDQQEVDRYELKVKIDEKKLPLKWTVGPAFLSISKDGLVSMGMVVGDSDQSTEVKLTLPTIHKNIAPLPAPIRLTNTGGSYSDDKWSFTGKVQLDIKKK